jgi:hypothetical protein
MGVFAQVQENYGIWEEVGNHVMRYVVKKALYAGGLVEMERGGGQSRVRKILTKRSRLLSKTRMPQVCYVIHIVLFEKMRKGFTSRILILRIFFLPQVARRQFGTQKLLGGVGVLGEEEISVNILMRETHHNAIRNIMDTHVYANVTRRSAIETISLLFLY